jgi:hypothetical protein
MNSYEHILFDVRNMTVLTPRQLVFVKTLPKDKVLELIEIYNCIMQNVNSPTRALSASEALVPGILQFTYTSSYTSSYIARSGNTTMMHCRMIDPE